MEARADPLQTAPASRPALRPTARWARLALVFLLAFTLLRGVIWGSTIPDFFGPDEDYHFLYMEYLTTQHALISPKKPLYPFEYGALVPLMRYNDYGYGPRASFPGDPHASVKAAGRFPDSFRKPRLFGRGVGVVHPPLYHLPGALINAALGDASVFTRFTVIRWYTALWGVAAVYFAWLLAAQVFRREPLQLLAASLVALQPMVAVLSGMANHDEALIATFTAALAMMAFMLRSAPRVRQGAWLGGAITLAMLVKGSALVLLPLAVLVYAGQALVSRPSRRVLLRSAALALGVPLLLAGAWYVRSAIVYGSLFGYTTSVVGGGGTVVRDTSLGHIFSLIHLWTGLTYRTYWWHWFWYEAPRFSIAYFLPVFIGGLGILGLAKLVFSRARTLLAPNQPLLRQIVLFVAASLAVWLPLMYTDIQKNINGGGFALTGGRYLLPAYPAVAILLIVGLRALVRPSAQPLVLSALAAVAAWFCWRAWTVNYLWRYYGDRIKGHGIGTPRHGGWDELFRRMSFDRPEFVTATTLEIVFVLMLLCLAAAVVVVGLGASGGPRSQAVRDAAGRPFRALRILSPSRRVTSPS